LSRDEKIRKLKDQLNEIKNALRVEMKSKKGLEKLVKFYGSDPVAQEKARGELEEQNRKIAAYKEHKSKISSQLAELGETPTDNDLGDDDAGETAPAGGVYGNQSAYYPPAAAAAPQTQIRVRGLYDYTATNETELSFREGDILSISEQDDSGWWYAELNGQFGFIPNNYVEVI
jgi:hypothetical protein